MASLAFLFKNDSERKIVDPVTGEAALVFDAIIRETPERSSTPTRNEVEDGSNVTDHVTLNPERTTLEFIVSNSPVSLERELIGIAGSGLSTLTQSVGPYSGLAAQLGTGVLGDSFINDSEDPAKAAYAKLEELWRNRIPFEVVTGFKTYSNMIITQLSAPRSAQNANALEGTLVLEEITIVQSEIVKLPEFKVKGDSAHSAASKADIGKQATKTAGKAGDNASVLFKGARSAGWVQ